ncbi:MAG: polyamine aminopropyltransferase [Cyanobacteriota bacterium]|nr:polyamine aminopropyltransferase [Cyanobacteriota bacterium]
MDFSQLQQQGKIPSEERHRDFWFTDADENQALALRHTGEILYDKTSELQRVRVIDTYAYGKTLTIDNMVMCTEKDEAHYHEAIAHPAILAHGAVKRVLVIGGGDGGTIREIFKHPEVEQVTMVEIDANVIEAAKLHLPALSQSFSHPRLQLIVGDGLKFVAEASPQTYDLIIVDGSDPVGPAQGLFSEEFYRNCSRALTSDGLLVTQAESPAFHQQVFVELNACLKRIFGKEKVYVVLFQIPTYPSGIWSFQLASKGQIDPRIVPREKVAEFEAVNSLRYYNTEIHQALFALPNYVKQML